MFTEKEMSDALKWLFDLFQPEDYEAYDEEEVGCAALCLPEVCMALRDKAETAYEYVVKTNIDRGFEYRGKELFMESNRLSGIVGRSDLFVCALLERDTVRRI